MSNQSVPRGPGLFEVGRAGGERFITNIRRIAGADRAPGSALVSSATILLGLLALGLFIVSLAAQYRYVFAVKHEALPSVIEALGLDVGMAIFSLLALGLAMAGQTAKIERALIVACALGSAGMNYAAAVVTSPRSVLAFIMPPIFLAIVVDRVVAVVRRHVLGDSERSPWTGLARALAGLGLVLLYGLRLLLAPPSTAGGVRRRVLLATPLPEPERPALPPAEVPIEGASASCVCPLPYAPGLIVPCVAAGRCMRPAPAIEPPELEGASKKARLNWWYRQDPAFGDRPAAAAAAKRIAPLVDLSEGTARAYIASILADLEKAS